MSSLDSVLGAALDARRELIADLLASDTNCYRLFHGTVEGMPGVTVDRYGDVLLAQSFHSSLAPDVLTTMNAWYREHHPVFVDFIPNDRSQGGSRVGNALGAEAKAPAERERVVRELGVAYSFRARHRGQDPWLFLDLRAARRRVQQIARGKSLLNLFAYTCGVGVCAAVAGATRVLNVDFARSSLDVGRANAALNGVSDRVACLESDFFPAARQLAGLGLPKTRGSASARNIPRVDAETFDIVFLDPPPQSRSPFGVVDLVADYGAVFKPALLATREGGELICCNNVASVDVSEWVDALTRAMRRHGRTLRGVEIIQPEADFPSSDGRPPLKVAVMGV